MALDLIYDRTAADVQRVLDLAKIGWANMTNAQKLAWTLGDAKEALEASDGALMDSLNSPIEVIGGTPLIKGAYNYSDLNRVEGAVEYLLDYLQDLVDELAAYEAAHDVAPDELFSMGYSVPTLTTKTDWDGDDFFTATDEARYLGNIAALRDLIALVDAPSLPTSMDALTYVGANAIEYLLVLIEQQSAQLLASNKALVDNTYPNFVYAAEVYAGEV